MELPEFDLRWFITASMAADRMGLRAKFDGRSHDGLEVMEVGEQFHDSDDVLLVEIGDPRR